jgi:hypothetical protein
VTPSEKPERPDSRTDEDANRTSVITPEDDDGATSATAEDSGAEDNGTSADGGSESPDGVQAPPPWDRATTAPPDESSAGTSAKSSKSAKSADKTAKADRSAGSAQAPGSAETPDTGAEERTNRQAEEPDTLRMVAPKAASAQSGTAGRTSSYSGGARSGAATATTSSSRRPSRGPRRASLQVKRVDPWSVLKLALVLSVALFFVWMIAVAVLYGVLDGMGVWDQLNGTFTELTQSGNTANEALISAGKVFSVASVIGGINIVLFTALATVAAFIYNVAADFAGGIELTLSERE